MCRWIAYKGRPTCPDRFLFDTEYSLVAQSQQARKSEATVNGDGFGLGWYERTRRPGVFRDVLPMWSDENLRNLSQQIRPSTFVAHVRAATDTASTRSNCHPFAYHHYLFMHNGQIGGYPKLRRRLESRLEDHYYEVRFGTTDSELLFLLLLQLGADVDFHRAANQVIEEVEQLQAAVKATDAFRFTAAFTDGRTLHAIRYASDDRAPTLFYQASSTGSVVVSEPLDDDHHTWTSVPQNHRLVIDGNSEPRVYALG